MSQKAFNLKLNVGGMEITTTVQAQSTSESPLEYVKDVADIMWIMVKAAHMVQTWAHKDETMSLVELSLNDAEPVFNEERSSQPLPMPPKNADVIIPVVKISHGFADGEDTFKVFGGDYTKWGIVAYKDSCADSVGMFAMPMGDNTPTKNMLARVQFNKSGQPYRITEIRYA